jgi:hypothetical protein
MNLRDHNRPCGHLPDDAPIVWGDKYHIGHSYYWAPFHSAWCPGGVQVELDPSRAFAIVGGYTGSAPEERDQIASEITAAVLGVDKL